MFASDTFERRKFAPMFTSPLKSPHPTATISKNLARSRGEVFARVKNAPQPDFSGPF